MKRVVLFLGAVLALTLASTLARVAPADAQDAGAPTPPPSEATPGETPTEGTPTEATAPEGDEGTPTQGTPTEGEGTPAEGQTEAQPPEGGTLETTTDEPVEPEVAAPPPPSTGQSEDTGEADEQPAEERPAWRNSTVRLTQYLGMYSFAPGLTSNPFFGSELELMGRWYFNDDMWIRARWGLSIEWTQNDGEFTYATLSDYEQEPVVTDLRVDFNRVLFAAGDFKARAAVGVRLPLSTTSLANELILGGYLTLTPTYVFPDVLEGLTFTGSFTFDGRIYGSNTRQLDAPIPRERLDGTGSASSTSTGSFLAPYQSIEVIGAELQLTPEIAVGADFTLWNIHSFQPPDTRYVTPTGGAVSDPRGIEVESQSDTSWVHLWGLGVTASYQPVSWLGIGLGYSALTQQTYGGGDDGGTVYRNPIVNIDSVVQLDLTFTPDQLLVPPRPAAEARRAARRVARAAQVAR